MKRILIAVLLATSATAIAAIAAHHPSHPAAKAAPDAGTLGFTEAEVRKVDKDAGKVTLKHGAIANLDMPAMTMVFRLPDADVLASLKEGDKIRFRAEKVGGAYTVTQVVK